jgi:hypothetical protein
MCPQQTSAAVCFTVQWQNGELSERCSTLTANISALYNTAKLELQRKDGEIKELRERCECDGFERWLCSTF